METAGWIVGIVSVIAWVAWWVVDYLQARRTNTEQWKEWPARHRETRPNVDMRAR